MLDIQWIRQKPELLDDHLRRRGLPPAAEEILDLDSNRRALLARLQALQTEKNHPVVTMHADPDRQDAEFHARRSKEKRLRDQIKEGKKLVEDVERAFRDAMLALPNILSEDVWDGGEGDFQVVYTSAWVPTFSKVNHEDHIDSEWGVGISGTRFTALRGPVARLERCLANMMLDLHTKEMEFTEVQVPSLVRTDTLRGTGQLPKFEEDLYQVEEDLWLSPTSEVQLTNALAGKIVPKEELPQRFTALTSCFRREAGAAGKRDRGILRQHEFRKVELVTICTEEDERLEYERMIMAVRVLLERLQLKYRVVQLASRDTGFSAMKTLDYEVWMPADDDWREVSSVSKCGDFQARRMNARYRDGDDVKFVRTLNGSGVALGRILAAVIEQHTTDGVLQLPPALAEYYGRDTIKL